MIKKIIHFFLGLLTVIIILIICKILFNISGFDFSDNLLGITAGLSFAFAFFFKRHKIYFMTTIILSVVLLSSNLYKNYIINMLKVIRLLGLLKNRQLRFLFML